METTIGTLLTELGYGLGAALVLYMLYNRQSRMNERTVELQTTLGETLTVIREQAATNADVKSATIRAAEMDRLYQSNHEMMIAGTANIIDSIPAAVDQIAEVQQQLSQEVNDLNAGLNAFAASSLNQQQELHTGVTTLQHQSENTSAASVESARRFAEQLGRVTECVEQNSRGLGALVTSLDEMSRTINAIESKLKEEF